MNDAQTFDLLLRFDRGVKRRALERVLLELPGVRPTGRDLAYCCDRWESEGVFFTIVGAGTWFGGVKSLLWSLQLGGSSAEARAFADHSAWVGQRLPGTLVELSAGRVLVWPQEVYARWEALSRSDGSGSRRLLAAGPARR